MRKLSAMIAIDVGSGMTNVLSGEDRFMYPSITTVYTPATMSGFMTSPEIVSGIRGILREDYVIGESAQNLAKSDKWVNTLTHDWAGSPGWFALLFGAVARAYPDGYVGDMSIITGVPQAIYASSREEIERKLSGEHQFKVRNEAGDWREYTLSVTGVVLPQAAAASIACIQDSDLPKIGVIDIGTHTTGYAALARTGDGNYKVQNFRSNGIEIGMSRVATLIADTVSRDYGQRPDINDAHEILLSGYAYIRGEKKDLSRQVSAALDTVGAQIVSGITMEWPHGAQDLAAIYLVGGGADCMYERLVDAFPQIAMTPHIESPWAVVTGLHIYGQRLLEGSDA